MKKLVIENYSKMFLYAWNIYRDSINTLHKFAAGAGVRKDKVYLPSSAGSKETAYQRWKFLANNISFKTENGYENITEETLATAVELFIADRMEQAHKFYNVRMCMMSVFLNNEPRENKDNEIIDYIRKARGEGDE